MKIVILHCFESYYNVRTKYLIDYLQGKNHDVITVCSDFNHSTKQKINVNRKKHIAIQTEPYKKNLSFARIKSHYKFAKKAFKQIEKLNPDVIYIIFPPNYLADQAVKYKRQHPNCKLIFDVFDMWPESFPVERVKSLAVLPFKYWRSLRNKNLKHADYIFLECRLYQEIINEQVPDVETNVLLLTKENRDFNETVLIKNDYENSSGSINICYLGSMNNTIDISSIEKLLSAINKIKPVTFHVIGDGNSRERLISVINDSGVTVKYYGKLYKESEKRPIFDLCSFGINMMKRTVSVGLTMKSVDYFQAGLPIINNIKGDTLELVDNYNIGFNVTEKNFYNVAKQVVNISNKELLKMKQNTKNVFESYFSINSFINKLDEMSSKLRL